MVQDEHVIKILLVYYEPSQSGQTSHVLSLVKGLDRRKYQLTVVLPEHLEKTAEMFRQFGVQVWPLPMRKIRWSLQAIVRLMRLLRQGDFDIVHVHSQEASLMTRILARAAGMRKVVYTPQTIDIRQEKWRGLYILVERFLARWTAKIVSVNERDRGRLISWKIPAEKVATIPNGIDLEAFHSPASLDSFRDRLGICPGDPLIMQVGRLSPQKDPLAFVAGAPAILRKYPQAQFVMIGDGPLKDAVLAQAQEYGVQSRVHVTGWLEDAFRFMPAASVVTLTSRWEGTPYSLLEAMAWGKPVVATDVNGCAEVVMNRETGFLVPVGDSAQWAERVIDLLDEPELAQEMGRCGREYVEKNFSMREMIAKIERLYSLL